MSRAQGGSTPYLLTLPGGLWLAIFFVVPMVVDAVAVAADRATSIDGFV